MRWLARCAESLATLLFFSPLAASAQNVALEVGANDFRISDMGPDANTEFWAGIAAVAYNPTANEYLVVWDGSDGSAEPVTEEREIFGQRINASTGEEVGENDFRISDMGTEGDVNFDATRPAVAYNPVADEYLVVWAGDDDIPPLLNTEWEIFGQRLDGSTGAEVGPNDFRISDMGPDGDVDFDALEAAVVYNATADEYLVVWYGDGNSPLAPDGDFQIFGQRLEGSTGAEVGENDFRISDMGPNGDQSFQVFTPAVIYSGSADEYLVVWDGDDDTGNLVDEEFEIYLQRLDGSTGAEVGANDLRISDMGLDGDPSFAGYWPALASNRAANEHLVVWLGEDDVDPLVEGEWETFGQTIFVPEPARSLMLVSGIALLPLLQRARERTKRCCCRG